MGRIVALGVIAIVLAGCRAQIALPDAPATDPYAERFRGRLTDWVPANYATDRGAWSQRAESTPPTMFGSLEDLDAVPVALVDMDSLVDARMPFGHTYEVAHCH